MTIDANNVVVGLGIVIHFLAFVRIFTVLESRLTALETTLKLLLQNLNGIQFIDRRNAGDN